MSPLSSQRLADTEMRAAMDCFAEAVAVFDASTLDCVYANSSAATLLCASLDDILGNRHPTLRQIGEAALVEVQVARRAVRIEREWEIGNGRRWIEVRAAAATTPGRRLIACSLRDATPHRDLLIASRDARRELERLTAAVDKAGDAVMIIDPRLLSYLHVNEACERIYGVPRKDMIERGVDWTERQLRPTRGGEWRSVFESVIAAYPSSKLVTQRFTRSDGNPVVVEVVRQALQVDGQWLVISVGRDVTASRTAQERLERLRAALDQAPDALMVMDPMNLRYVDLNEAAARLYGLTREEMLDKGMDWVGRRLGLRWGDGLRDLFSQVIALYPASFTEVREFPRIGASPARIEWTRRAVRVDERWLIVNVGRDVTESHAGQQRLARLGAALDEAADGLLVIDPVRMRCLDVNKSAAGLYGKARDEILGGDLQWFERYLDLKEPGALRARLDALVDQAPEPTVDILPSVAREDDRVVETTMRAVSIDGAWLVLAIARDITSRERARRDRERHIAELERSNAELEQFAYIVSHDLSEPLRMISSYAQLLAKRRRDDLDPDSRDFIGFIVDGARRMKSLMDDLLTYARAGRANVRFGTYKLDELLDSALANLVTSIEQAGAIIQRPAGLPTVHCDKTGMVQLFQNLIGNAIKFRGDAAVVVRVDARASPEGWEFSVADNGIGIEPQYFDRIFAVFQRLHTRERYEGTGVGLAICQKIVERHGGRIWVESMPQQGACFRFTLPTAARSS